MYVRYKYYQSLMKWRSERLFSEACCISAMSVQYFVLKPETCKVLQTWRVAILVPSQVSCP